jgi:hypothetical protein
MIKQESYSVDTSDSGVVHIHHVQLEDTGVDMGGHMWLERSNLRWVVDSLQACLGTYAFPGVETQSGQDHLKVFESGAEQAPIINLRNRRPKDAPHGGVYALMMSKPVAEKLTRELATLG